MLPLPPRVSSLAAFFAILTLGTAGSLADARPSADAAKWEALVQKKLREPAPEEGAVIALGSSSIARWTTIHEDLAPLRVYNMGIGGSQMQHAVQWFLPKLVLPFRPRGVLLYEGSNDLAAGVSPAEVLLQFQLLHKQLHEALPETRLFVISIMAGPGKRFEKWEAIQEANHLLETECAQYPWMRFLDTTQALLDPNGRPRPECFIPNDIHMTPEGYAVWKKVVAPALLEALSPP
ncbi:MAG: hypothetical protein EBS01_09945 [Verrucomicrobia bacterium]|nr:hypothetical protein [Verrucomicrobiota bacterium]